MNAVIARLSSITKQRAAELVLLADPDAEYTSQILASITEMTPDNWRAFSQFLALVEEEAVVNWIKKDGLADSIRAEAVKLHEKENQRPPEVVPPSYAKEREILRAVYEEARSFLRHNGLDQHKAGHAVDRMDDAVERVKQFDGTTDEEDL